MIPRRFISSMADLTRPFAAALGLLYLVGFLVVASHLSRYGVSSFSVLQLQYLIAGVWALGPPTLYGSLLHVQQRFDDRATPEVGDKLNWRRFAISSLGTGLPSALLLGLLFRIPNVSADMHWKTGLGLFLFFWAMIIFGQLLWNSRTIDNTRETWWCNRGHAAPFYLAFLFMIVLCYVLWFSVHIYPLIPSSLGGGRPLTVAFIEGDKKMPEEIQKADGSAKRSIPYKLLLATDKSFVVVSPSEKERSLEINRDSVAGIVVLSAN